MACGLTESQNSVQTSSDGTHRRPLPIPSCLAAYTSSLLELVIQTSSDRTFEHLRPLPIPPGPAANTSSLLELVIGFSVPSSMRCDRTAPTPYGEASQASSSSRSGSKCTRRRGKVSNNLASRKALSWSDPHVQIVVFWSSLWRRAKTLDRLGKNFCNEAQDLYDLKASMRASQAVLRC